MLQLKKKNKIYMLTKNLKTKKASKKLNYVKIGPLFIKQQKESINYVLNLSFDIKIHLIFHVSLLKLTDPKISIQDTFYFQYKKKQI